MLKKISYFLIYYFNKLFTENNSLINEDWGLQLKKNF